MQGEWAPKIGKFNATANPVSYVTPGGANHLEAKATA